LAALALAVALLGALAAVLPLRWALLLVLALIGGLALVRTPELGLCLLAFTVPFGSLFEVALGGLTIGPSELLLTATLGALLLRGLARRSFASMPSRLWLAFGLYALLTALSLLRAEALTLALKELAKWVEMLLLLWMAATLTDTRWRTALVLALLAGGALHGLLGIYQFLLRVGPEGFLLFGRYMRAHGTFLQPNPYGGFLGLLLPLAYATAWLTARPAWRGDRGQCALLMAATGSAAIMALALVMSWSRGALLGAAAGAALVALWMLRRAPWALGAALAVALVAAPLGSRLLPGGYLTRLSGQSAYLGQDLRLIEIDDDNFSTIERLAHWQAAWQMFARAPYLGVGAGQYAVVYPQVALPRWQDPLGHAHNYYLHVLAEHGLVGLLAFLALCAAVPLTLWQALSRQRARSAACDRGLALGALGLWGHLLAHSLVDNLFVHEMYLLMALIIGAALAERPAATPAASPTEMERPS
jgi:O-antigen ligase